MIQHYFHKGWGRYNKHDRLGRVGYAVILYGKQIIYYIK